ncbi:hypothetical protein Anas_00142 [Armadillidium nasatum]|uniref:Uncharacterized protein n=1 Tax=Armadillidium nasatum TaxID=96803 RepID=A0A5N5STR9_9CRUS|nr:hypothetical protein Anas_00142 [Armadillidium nasatum]
MERKRTLKATNATVLESRRQQNCAILLSKLKLSNEELISCSILLQHIINSLVYLFIDNFHISYNIN